jgi:phage-related minor tail protein
MEVSPTGAPSSVVPPHVTDPVALLHVMVNLQSQSLELQRQIFEMQKQQLELTREAAQFNRDQRARQIAELERWQQAHEPMIDDSKQVLGQLEEVHASLMREVANYVEDNHENLVDGDFALSDFVDKFGPKLAHLNTMLAILRPLAAAAGAKRSESTS